MKCFEFNAVDFSDNLYKNDCTRIHHYLKDCGKLNISWTEIPDYYKKFSKEVLNKSWNSNPDDDELYVFASWLSKKDTK